MVPPGMAKAVASPSTTPYHRFALWVYAVAESDVVVTHLEVDVHHMHFALLTLSVLPLLVEGKIATVGNDRRLPIS